MQSVDLSGLKQLDDDLEAIFNELPRKRRELHEKIADVIKSEVDIQITNSGLNDSSGKVKGWQDSYVGSGGGYAAIRATDKSTGANSPGAITNYLENGHKIRQPSGNYRKYRPRIKKAYVDGYHFYKTARGNVESKAIEAAEEFVQEITEKMEG
ncbi:hypothetical protein [Lachnoclostridium phytofermentans]|uniref:hypothetical protein n=1 Tax=Lachnoclostridium phytofermentans TaxID=66219 RepID=UPI000498594D|nr:hypothetical protein [Lachnoclostridium phytofermentans]